MKKITKILIVFMALLLLASCSRAYQPTNYQKKKNKKCDCSRWSYNNLENEQDVYVVG